MPVPNGKIETNNYNDNNNNNNYKKHRRWSLIGILSKKMKLKKSQESVDFCPYDGRINRKATRNVRLDGGGGSTADCHIEQYTCSPRLIRRCNSLQYATSARVSAAYSNTVSQTALNEWKLSQQSVYSSGSSACFSDIGGGACKSYENGNQSSSSSSSCCNALGDEENERKLVRNAVPPYYRRSSEIGHCRNKMTNRNQPAKKLVGKKIPPPPPPRDPNIKAVYYIRNNRLLSRESDSTYFSQGSDDDRGVADNDDDDVCENDNVPRGIVADRRPNEIGKEPARSRRPIQMGDVETLSTECDEDAEPRVQTAEEAIRELEDIYNSLGLSDEELLDRAERRDLPTYHQNLRYENDELDCGVHTALQKRRRRRMSPKTPRRACVPDTIFDDMAYRKLNKKETTGRKGCAPGGSFLLVLPTVYNVDDKRPSGEPDVTLDDVVFRSRRQHLNFLKIADPQPPFGIPLGPIVAAAASDYLHAVPDCQRYRSSFRPRKMPDTVEDDLAFRALRRDRANKTCIDLSYVRGSHRRFATPSCKPTAVGNGMKNDTHWIVKKAQRSSRSSDENRTVRLVLDHRRRGPIVLTAGRFGSGGSAATDRTSKSSFFRTSPSPPPVAPHEPPHGLRSLTYRPNALTAKRYDDDDDGGGLTLLYLMDYEDGGGKNRRILTEFQPNFRELIRREHALMCRSPSSGNVAASSVIAVGHNEIIETRRRGFAADDAADTTAAKERKEDPPPPPVEDNDVVAPNPPDRGMPGCLEVCLYITIYVYELFSVNAYSTFIALIFLVALHVCRRLS